MKHSYRNCNIIICIIFLLLQTIWGNVNHHGQTNAGLQFLLTEFSTHADSYVTIFNQNDEDVAEVTVKVANSQYRHLHLQTNESYSFKIPSYLRVNEIGVFDKVVKINSVNKVQIKAMIHTYNQSVNAMMLSPIETYDQIYYPVADCVHTSVIYVFATENPTIVNITFPTNLNDVFMDFDGHAYTGGDTLVVELKSGTFGRLESNRSLSGSCIISNERIAVYSGCDPFAYPEEFTFEQVPGVNFIGKQYILIANSQSDYNLEYFQIITTQSDTKVRVENGQCAIWKFNEQGFITKKFFADVFVMIVADKPVVVAHFIYDYEYSMYYVTPKENDESLYKVVTGRGQMSAMTLNYGENTDYSLLINDEVINGFTPYTTKLQWLYYGRIPSLFPNVTVVTIHQTNNDEFGGYIHGKYNGRLAVTSLGQRYEAIKRTCKEGESESKANCEYVDIFCDQTTASSASTSIITSSKLASTPITSTTPQSMSSSATSSTSASVSSIMLTTLQASSTTSHTTSLPLTISSASTSIRQSTSSSTTTATSVNTQSSTFAPTNALNFSCEGIGYSLFSSGINSICYWLLNHDNSMSGSMKECGRSGGQLAIIPNLEANIAVAQLNLSGNNYYIGYQSNPNGVITVLNQNAAWTNFEKGHPKGFSCVILHSSSNNQWRGDICTVQIKALCSRCFYGGTDCYNAPQTSAAILDTTTVKLTTNEKSTTVADTTTAAKLAFMTSAVTMSKSSTTTKETTLNTLPTASSTSNDECNCRCYSQYYIRPVNMTKELVHYLGQLKARTSVNKRTLSSNARRKTCADDSRPTAKVSGYTGAVILTFVFGGLIALDVPLLIAEIKINFLGIGR